LKKEYPGDLEIELNYAEALLEQKFDKPSILHHSCGEKMLSFVAYPGSQTPCQS
jgi:hypothetical protein